MAVIDAALGRPGVDSLMAQLRDASASGRTVELRGNGSVLDRTAPGSATPVPTLELAGLTGVIECEPSDLVITVGAAMSVTELDAILAANGQECPLDDPTGASTVGGRVATALAGIRRLGVGPVRDWVLGVGFITGEGTLRRGGGRTVKNVTGFDVPRLLCGSWGTLGAIVDVTLRVRPRPRWSGWFVGEGRLSQERLAGLHAPSAVLVGPSTSHVLLEGHPEDATDQARAAGLRPADAPVVPGPARCAVPVADLPELLTRLPRSGWLAQWGVGTVHLDDPGVLRDLGTSDLDGRIRRLHLDGSDEPDLARTPGNADMHRRLRQAFDPYGVLAPWRFPV